MTILTVVYNWFSPLLVNDEFKRSRNDPRDAYFLWPLQSIATAVQHSIIVFNYLSFAQSRYCWRTLMRVLLKGCSENQLKPTRETMLRFSLFLRFTLRSEQTSRLSNLEKWLSGRSERKNLFCLSTFPCFPGFASSINEWANFGVNYQMACLRSSSLS